MHPRHVPTPGHNTPPGASGKNCTPNHLQTAGKETGSFQRPNEAVKVGALFTASALG